MNVLIVNPIIYTSETKQIIRAKTIKDTMIYDLCLAFFEEGHTVTLYAAEPFKPINEEEYPFAVIWGKCTLQKFFMPHRLPYMPNFQKYMKVHINDIDMVICSEVFQLSTLSAALLSKEKTVVWHELAKHNAILKKIPSLFWYNVVARLFMRNVKVVPRSKEAQSFIRRYCRNTQDTVIDHGVNLDKFVPSKKKTDSFIVCSQLIARKQIDCILNKFAAFEKKHAKEYVLYIIGTGGQRDYLEETAVQLGIEDAVVFLGYLQHEELLPYLTAAKALLVNTEKDNNMVSIVESIAVGTPVVTTEVPYNSAYIKSEHLGIAKDDWNESDLEEIVQNNAYYSMNCLRYRKYLSTKERVREFERIIANEK